MFTRLRSLYADCRELLGQPAAWSNLLTVGGAMAISTGAYWIYPPAGLITAGLAAIAVAVLMHSDPPAEY